MPLAPPCAPCLPTTGPPSSLCPLPHAFYRLVPVVLTLSYMPILGLVCPLVPHILPVVLPATPPVPPLIVSWRQVFLLPTTILWDLLFLLFTDGSYPSTHHALLYNPTTTHTTPTQSLIITYLPTNSFALTHLLSSSAQCLITPHCAHSHLCLPLPYATCHTTLPSLCLPLIYLTTTGMVGPYNFVTF